MLNNLQRFGLIFPIVLSVTACDTFSGKELALNSDVVSAEGVRSMVHGKDFVKPNSYKFNEVNVDQIIADVVGSGKGIKDVSMPKERNLIQDRLIAASNQRCNLYKRFIQRIGTQTNFFLGALSTLAGGAGAIVTGADTARILSGVAGGASGLRSEFNETYFRSQAIHLIVKGIKSRRAATRQKILDSRFDKQAVGLEKYSAAMAIGDAITYHGECTIMAGLEEANDKLTTSDEVGLKKMETFLKNFNNVKKLLESSK